MSPSRYSAGKVKYLEIPDEPETAPEIKDVTIIVVVALIISLPT